MKTDLKDSKRYHISALIRTEALQDAIKTAG